MYNFAQLGAHATYADVLHKKLYPFWVQSASGYWDVYTIAQAEGVSVTDLQTTVQILINTGRAVWTNTIQTHFTLVNQFSLLTSLSQLGY